jgi:hypothetical protein
MGAVLQLAGISTSLKENKHEYIQATKVRRKGTTCFTMFVRSTLFAKECLESKNKVENRSKQNERIAFCPWKPLKDRIVFKLSQ